MKDDSLASLNSIHQAACHVGDRLTRLTLSDGSVNQLNLSEEKFVGGFFFGDKLQLQTYNSHTVLYYT